MTDNCSGGGTASKIVPALLVAVAVAAVAVLCAVPGSDGADANNDAVAKIGDAEYDTLEAAFKAATTNQTITVVKDCSSSKVTIDGGRTLTLALNGKTVTFTDSDYIALQHGKLTVSGTGTLKEEKPYWAPIMVYGSTTSTDENYSVLEVTGTSEDSPITLYGLAGVMVRDLNNGGSSYGVNVSLKNVVIESVLDADGATGYGLYIQGRIKDSMNAPIISVSGNYSEPSSPQFCPIGRPGYPYRCT